MNPIEYYEKMVELSYNTNNRQQPVRYTTYKNSIYTEYVNFWVRDLCMSGNVYEGSTATKKYNVVENCDIIDDQWIVGGWAILSYKGKFYKIDWRKRDEIVEVYEENDMIYYCPFEVFPNWDSKDLAI